MIFLSSWQRKSRKDGCIRYRRIETDKQKGDDGRGPGGGVDSWCACCRALQRKPEEEAMMCTARI